MRKKTWLLLTYCLLPIVKHKTTEKFSKQGLQLNY